MLLRKQERMLFHTYSALFFFERPYLQLELHRVLCYTVGDSFYSIRESYEI